MIGDVGGAIIFFMAMLATLLIGVYTLAYTAHILLTVIDGTAGGAAEIDWPSEPYIDWLWKFAYLVWLVAFWLVPLVFVSQWLLRTRPVADALPGILATAALLFWFLFPISLLSSLSASSRWVIFSPALLSRLAQRAGSVLAFYLLTGLLLAAGAAAVYGLFLIDSVFITVAAALVVTAVLLIYARLFGRLALQLRFTRGRETRPQPARRRPMTQSQAAARVAQTARRGRVLRTGDLPPVNAPDEAARTGYDVHLDDDPQPVPTPRRPPADPVEGQYDLADEPLPAEVPRGRVPEKLLNPSEYELALAGRGRAIRPPERPWTSGVWGFPFAAAHRGPLVWMTLGFAVTGIMFRLMVSYMPG